ncbi:MAG TPA: methionyl-tRNA formyltransferase [Trueperaceae bacterium]
MRLVFFGSPAFALPSLLALQQRFEVVLVVSQPDKPAGRGMSSSPPPVARKARELGLELAQPARLKGNDEFARRLAELEPDVAVTAAYGKILPRSLLDVPSHGFLNVHASLLPAYRGAAPIQWAIINGEEETGVSIMQTEAGLDTGPVCLQRRCRIGPDERAPELFDRLAELGAAAICEALERLGRGELECRPQDDDAATLAPMLTRAHGEIDWRRPAKASFDRFRGTYGWPGSRFGFRGKWVRVYEMRPADGAGEPGEVLEVSGAGLVVACGEGALLLEVVQAEGKARNRARDWANGYGVKVGSRLA